VTPVVLSPEVSCKHCGEPILLHRANLAPIRDNPMGQSTRFYPTAVSCPACKHVNIYEHFPQERYLPEESTVQQAQKIRLECGWPDCEGNLRVVSIAQADDWSVEATTWIFDERVLCSNGHPFRLRSGDVRK